jgi:hypothetical protein
MAVNPAVVKAVIAIATDKRTWKLIGATLGVLLFLCLLPALVLLAFLSGSSEIDKNEVMSQINISAVVDSMSLEKKAELQNFDTVMRSISDEIKNQNADINPIKAQVIYLCALGGKEKESVTFYNDYISCYKNADENGVFDNITNKFGVVFTADEKEKIKKLYTKIIENNEKKEEK